MHIEDNNIEIDEKNMNIREVNDGRVVLYKRTFKKYKDGDKKTIEIYEEPCEVLDSKLISWLYNLSFESGERVEEDGKMKIVLYGVKNIIRFSDRPYQFWSPLNSVQFTELWEKSLDKKSFYLSPPNGVLGINGKNHVLDIQKLQENHIEDSVEFEITMISHEIIPKHFSSGAFFIDNNTEKKHQQKHQMDVSNNRLRNSLGSFRNSTHSFNRDSRKSRKSRNRMRLIR